MGVSHSELAEPVQSTSRLGGRPPGLINEGNTCFMNAAMQAISACPPFISFMYRLLSLNAELLSSEAVLYSHDHAADESGATLVFQLAHLLSLLAYPSQAAQDTPLRLTSIVNTEHMVSMVNGEQQDAHEALFSTLMCVISEQQQRNFSSHLAHSLSCSALGMDTLYAAAAAAPDVGEPGAPPSSPAFYDAATSSDAASIASSSTFAAYVPTQSAARRQARAILRRRAVAAAHAPPFSPPASMPPHTNADEKKASGAAACAADIPTNPMTGWILRRTKCTSCSAGQEWSCEPFVCLSVSPPYIPGAVPTLSSCLRNFFSTEHIPDWRCDVCGGSGCIKACRLARRPAVLAVHVQALGGGRVVFPSSVDVGRDCGMDAGSAASSPNAAPSQHDRSYSLVSVVQHVGVDGAGHYVAFRREPQILQNGDGPHSSSPSGWLCADDARMLSVSQERVMSVRPFLLLYMSNACCGTGGAAAATAKVQVSQWPQLQAAFEHLVELPDGETHPVPTSAGGKGGVVASKLDTLVEFRQRLGLLKGASAGLATISVAGDHNIESVVSDGRT